MGSSMDTKRVFSKAVWESQVGYCRALRRGGFISISGTTAVDEHGEIYEPTNAYEQTKRCFEIIEQALKKLEASLHDVVRTRMFVRDIAQWAEYGRAHAEAFANFPPASTMIEVKSFIHQDILIEIEAEALCLE